MAITGFTQLLPLVSSYDITFNPHNSRAIFKKLLVHMYVRKLQKKTSSYTQKAVTRLHLIVHTHTGSSTWCTCLAKNVRQRVAENLLSYLTIQQLSEELDASPTAIKRDFIDENTCLRYPPLESCKMLIKQSFCVMFLLLYSYTQEREIWRLKNAGICRVYKKNCS